MLSNSKNKEGLNLDQKLKEIKKPEDKIAYILKTLDKISFPKSPLPIKKVDNIESKYKNSKNSQASYNFDKNEDGEIINESYQINKNLEENRKNNKEELIGIAIHEVRHRFQHEKENLELFTPKNLKRFQKNSLTLKLFKEKTGETFKHFIEREHSSYLSKNDFDAIVVENLSRGLIYEGISLSKIQSIVSKDAEEIIKRTDTLLKENKE